MKTLGLIFAALIIGCSSASDSLGPTPPTKKPAAKIAVSSVLSIGKKPVVSGRRVSFSVVGDSLIPVDSTGLVFTDAVCSEQLNMSYVIDTTGVVSGNEDGVPPNGGETCVYTVDGYGWHAGDISGPGASPLNGPFTGRVWGDSVSFNLTYHNPIELVNAGTLPETADVIAVGVAVDSQHSAGTWTCNGQCGSTAQGASGQWSMAITQASTLTAP